MNACLADGAIISIDPGSYEHSGLGSAIGATFDQVDASRVSQEVRAVGAHGAICFDGWVEA